jgi:hypothetical protein
MPQVVGQVVWFHLDQDYAEVSCMVDAFGKETQHGVKAVPVLGWQAHHLIHASY